MRIKCYNLLWCGLFPGHSQGFFGLKSDFPTVRKAQIRAYINWVSLLWLVIVQGIHSVELGPKELDLSWCEPGPVRFMSVSARWNSYMDLEVYISLEGTGQCNYS